jgi:hypothetical protein
MAVFKKQGVYWIDYYVSGHRKRERIGPDKRLAENVLRKRKVEIAEGKFLDRQRPVTTTFDDLADSYLTWIRPNDELGIPARKRSWKSHDLYAIGQLRAYFGGNQLTAITPAMIGQYRDWRRSSISRRKQPISVATVNRELSCLKRMFNVACKGLLCSRGVYLFTTLCPTSALSGNITNLTACCRLRSLMGSITALKRGSSQCCSWPIILVCGRVKSARFDGIK